MRRWHRQAKRRNARKDKKIPTMQAVKVGKMFRAYGSENVVIVNPVNDKKRLFVRPRDWSVERQEKQIKRIGSEVNMIELNKLMHNKLGVVKLIY